MMWFTSDHHFGHSNIIRYSGRPFRDVDRMDRALVDLWNQIVELGDTVWYLGDLTLDRHPDTLGVVSCLHGRVLLVPGNHDAPWNGHRKPRYHDRYLAGGIAEIVDRPSLTIAGRHVIMSHFPYRGDHTELDRYVEHRPVDRGTWLLHGHVHEAWRQRDRQINVGVDAWAGRPVSVDTIAELIEAGPRDLDPLPWPA